MKTKYTGAGIIFTALLLLLSLHITAAVDIGSTRICYGDTTVLYNQSTVPRSALVQWDTDNDGFYNDATGDTVRLVYAVADSFKVRLKITDSTGAVFYSGAHEVIVDPVPVPAFDWVGKCQGSDIRFFNRSAIADASTLTYEWDFMGNGNTDATTSDATHAYTTAGSYNVQLRVASGFGCSASVVDTVLIFALPDAALSVLPASPCANTQIVFSNETVYTAGDVATAVWNFGDTTLGFGNDSTIHSYLAGGTYTIGLKVTDENGCVDSTTSTLVVLNDVSYSIAISNGTVIEQGTETDIEVTGDFTTLQWNDSNTDNPRTVADSGTYVFTVASGAGCQKTDSVHISWTEVLDRTVSGNDLLTPNNDGKNDLLVFKNIAVFAACKLEVYNRYGAKVYSNDKYTNDWNGTDGSTELPAGPYYYILKCDNEEEIKSSTNIIR